MASSTSAAARRAELPPFPVGMHFDYSKLQRAGASTLDAAIDKFRDRVMCSAADAISLRLTNAAPFSPPINMPKPRGPGDYPGSLQSLLSRDGAEPSAAELAQGLGLPIGWSNEMKQFLVDQTAQDEQATVLVASTAVVPFSHASAAILAAPLCGDSFAAAAALDSLPSAHSAQTPALSSVANPPPASPTTNAMPIIDGGAYDQELTDELKREFQLAASQSLQQNDSAVGAQSASVPAAAAATPAEMAINERRAHSNRPPSPLMDIMDPQLPTVSPLDSQAAPASAVQDLLEEEEEEEIEHGEIHHHQQQQQQQQQQPKPKAKHPLNQLLDEISIESLDAASGTGENDADSMFVDGAEDEDGDDDDDDESCYSSAVAPLSPASLAAPRPRRQAAVAALEAIAPSTGNQTTSYVKNGAQDESDEDDAEDDDDDDASDKPKSLGDNDSASSLGALSEDMPALGSGPQSEDSSFALNGDETSSSSGSLSSGASSTDSNGSDSFEAPEDEESDAADEDDMEENSDVVIVKTAESTPAPSKPLGSKRPAPQTEEARKRTSAPSAAASAANTMIETYIEQKNSHKKGQKREQLKDVAESSSKRGGQHKSLRDAGTVRFGTEIEEAMFNMFHWKLSRERDEPLQVDSPLTSALQDRPPVLSAEQRRAVELHNRLILCKSAETREAIEKAASALATASLDTECKEKAAWIYHTLLADPQVSVRLTPVEGSRVCEISGEQTSSGSTVKLFVYSTSVCRSFVVAAHVVDGFNDIQLALSPLAWTDANEESVKFSFEGYKNHSAGLARLAKWNSSRHVKYIQRLASGEMLGYVK